MTPEERLERCKERASQKILNGEEMFTITEVAAIFGRKTHTIRSWEKKEIIPKFKKYAKDEKFEGHRLYMRRWYTREELYQVICAVLDYDWERDRGFDKEYLENIRKYLKIQCEINSTERTRDKPMYYT